MVPVKHTLVPGGIDKLFEQKNKEQENKIILLYNIYNLSFVTVSAGTILI